MLVNKSCKIKFYVRCFSLFNACFVVSQDLVMDILRVLSSPDLEVRKKTLQLALSLVSSRNIEEVCIQCVIGNRVRWKRVVLALCSTLREED